MIQFSYIHVPTNRKLEQFAIKNFQSVMKQSNVLRVDVTFKRIFDLRNRVREVANVLVTTKDKNIICEIKSTKFKKSIEIATDSLTRKVNNGSDLLTA
ncbi:hypothetical protein LX97_02934 [Nonlabens dokdonensis]|jgi:hypothetical protein|uniref:Uncharacterized protein n=2 Tax=Nonlabens dokdonensis TaxID=328515 RepID=L7WH41_NONDD|nr:HPF/RaiA family ribosome-associated protein [Nonlabens dokdonensis]AGC78273.1 hypothetical protein DDD_3146 [Nonlabens dokdonensis DSW-6]PZX37839.1 hypothetical protein LX97_02934 [Nonlabens dokdonensis]